MYPVVIMQADVWDPDIVRTINGPPFPGGAIDYPTPLQVLIYGATTQLLCATTDFCIINGNPNNSFVPGKIREAFNFDHRLFAGLEPGGRSQAGAGEIVIDDPENELATWPVNYGWDGRDITLLYMADDRAQYSSANVVARLTCDGLEWDTLRKTIRLRNLDWLFERPLHQRFYGGTGARDGVASVAGRPVPHCYGRRFNITPVLFDAANQVYQVHVRRIQSIDAVRDGGSALAFTADYQNYEALIAASLTLGQYATCLAEGMARLGGALARSLTCDVHGEAEVSYVSTVGTIVRRIVSQGPVGAKFPDPERFDTVAFAALETDEPGEVGLYLPEPVTIADALDQLMAGVEGYWTVTLLGFFTAGVWKAPSGTPDLILDYYSDILGEIERQGPIPRTATMMGWKRADTVQTGGDLADGTSDTDRALYGAQYRFAPAIDENAFLKYPSNRRVLVPSNDYNEANAQARAARSQALYGVPRDSCRVPALFNPFADVLAKVVRIDNHPRFGATALFRCAGMAAVHSSARGELLLWK